jgi:predicted HicB family RNase H-like nuclease
MEQTKKCGNLVKQFNLRIPPKLRERLEAIAEEREVNMTYLILDALRDLVEQTDKKEKENVR